jgi:hypothetical protein
MTRVFFYGLFMDTDLLEDMGLHPVVVGSAELREHAILIAERATLVPDKAASAFGVVMDLAEAELLDLYSQPGLQDYLPERIEPRMLTGQAMPDVVCYILPPELTAGTPNGLYALKLSQLVQKLSIPEDYSKAIRAAGDS